MIPRLGDGNMYHYIRNYKCVYSLENDSPSRGRKRYKELLISLKTFSV